MCLRCQNILSLLYKEWHIIKKVYQRGGKRQHDNGEIYAISLLCTQVMKIEYQNLPSSKVKASEKKIHSLDEVSKEFHGKWNEFQDKFRKLLSLSVGFPTVTCKIFWKPQSPEIGQPLAGQKSLLRSDGPTNWTQFNRCIPKQRKNSESRNLIRILNRSHHSLTSPTSWLPEV